MNTNLSSKVVLVTGGTSGIGRAAALAFARLGAQVVVAGRREKEGAEVVAQIKAKSGNALFVKTDVTRESDLAELVTKTVDAYGRLDIAFNNAGVEGNFGLTTVEQTEAHYHHVFDANVKGVLFSMKHEIPAMLKVGGGVIINNASVLGSVAAPGATVYTASKFAVVGLTKSAALEYAQKGIRINTVSPGPIQTEMFNRAFGTGDSDVKKAFLATLPIGRWGNAEEIADAVVWLSLPGASFVTGHDLVIDGGYSAH
jgi:NAD(P)-dependent dehydrogenase (short-subunit alcohol dehydrogenase family)